MLCILHGLYHLRAVRTIKPLFIACRLFLLHQVNVPALRARVSPGLDDRDALAVAEVDARDAGLERESVTLFNWNELRDVSFFFSINCNDLGTSWSSKFLGSELIWKNRETDKIRIFEAIDASHTAKRLKYLRQTE